MNFIRITLLIFFVSTIMVYGQNEACHKSTEGTDFWFGFMEGRNYQDGHYCEITLSSSYNCIYKIYIGKSVAPFTSGPVTPNIPVKVRIDWKLVEAIGSESIQEKAIHLVSDQPLNVYALNWSPNSSEVALIYPSNSIGNEYYTMCYTPHIDGNGINTGSGRNSEFLIVASTDNTVVSITTTKVTDKGKAANTPYSITLNQGEVYQVQSENLPIPAWPGQGDLTGSYIKSEKPIAVFSGSLSTTVPGDASVSAWDHLYEQMPPLQTWGRKFVAVPLKSRREDTYRVLAAEDNTTVRIGSNSPVVINKGKYYEFMLSYTTPSLIESDKPVLLAQFSNSNSVDKTFTGGDGDPFLVIVSPVNQTREKVAFVAYDSPQITSKFFINVVVKDDVIGLVKLDDTVVSFNSLSATGYSYAQISIGKGNHFIESTQPGKGFIAYVYGFGGVEAYGYGVGFNLDIVLDLGSNINASGEKLVVRCDKDESIVLNAGNAFDSYLWSTGETTSSIKVSDPGTYSVAVSTADKCKLTDEIKLLVSKPLLNLGPDLTVCNPETVVLDAGANDQLTNFLWTTPQTSQTDQKITVSKPGKYAVEAINKYNCKVSDEINVAFTDKPKLDFSALDTLICGTFGGTLKVNSEKTVTYSIQADPKVSTNGLNVSVLPVNAGTYPVILTATDQYSCKTDTAFNLGFYKIPEVAFSILSDECSGYNLNVTYVGDAKINTSNFKWEYDGGVNADKPGLNSLIVPLGVNKAQRDLSLTVTENGCYKSYIQNINVTPNLTLQNDIKQGCEPFKTDFSAENSELVDYFWDFGDGSPIEKSDKYTSHLYQRAGNYDVKLKVTTKDAKCSNEVKVDKMVHVFPIPDVAFSLSSDKCLNPGVNEISYAGLIGTPKDKYYWDLTQFGLSEILKDPLLSQGPFQFDLKIHPQINMGLKVISEHGCESALQSITLKRKPDFSITSDVLAGCIPFDAVLLGKVNDNVDLVDFSWDFGDGFKGTGSSVSHTYDIQDKKYTISLSGKSSVTGCSNLAVKNNSLQTYPKPVAAFSIDNDVVYNDQPTVNFSNSSIGANSYLWDFGDQLTSAEKNPSHDYRLTGYRKVLLDVYNEFNCNDTVSHNLLVAFDRIFPPNGFSPNAPDAVDRVFLLNSAGITSEGYHFTVLSRWNDLVFEVKDEIKGWDGKMKNGVWAPSGTYLWILNFTDFLGRKHRQSGSVTLVY